MSVQEGGMFTVYLSSGFLTVSRRDFARMNRGILWNLDRSKRTCPAHQLQRMILANLGVSHNIPYTKTVILCTFSGE